MRSRSAISQIVRLAAEQLNGQPVARMNGCREAERLLGYFLIRASQPLVGHMPPPPSLIGFAPALVGEGQEHVIHIDDRHRRPLAFGPGYAGQQALDRLFPLSVTVK